MGYVPDAIISGRNGRKNMLDFDNTSEEVCPNCLQPESTMVVCKHCGYKYPQNLEDIEDDPWWFWVLLALFILLICYIFGTLLYWLIKTPDMSLLDVLHSQWHRIVSMKIR